MSPDEMAKLVGTLGFPIMAAVAMGYALFIIGKNLLDRQTKALDVTVAEMRQQTQLLTDIKHGLSDICRATCHQCETFSPRRSKP